MFFDTNYVQTLISHLACSIVSCPTGWSSSWGQTNQQRGKVENVGKGSKHVRIEALTRLQDGMGFSASATLSAGGKEQASMLVISPKTK